MKSLHIALSFVALSFLANSANAQQSEIGKLKVTEVPTKSKNIFISATLITPELSTREQAAWAILASSLIEGNQIYSADDLYAYGSQGKSSPQIQWNDEVLSIQLEVPSDGLLLGLKLMDSILRKPLLERDRIVQRTKELGIPLSSDMGTAMKGQLGDLSRADGRVLNDTFTRVFDPKNVGIAVSAGDAPGQRTRQVLEFFKDWKSKNSYEDSWGPSKTPFAGPGLTSLTVWKAPSVTMSQKDASKILAIFALGVGLESITFKEIREKNGWSYVQDIFLRTERTGWRPMFIMAGDPIATNSIKETMLEGIKTLDEFQLKRAKGLANSCFTRGNPYSPIFVSPYQQYKATEQDRVSWASFALKVYGSQQPEMIVNSLQEVDLETLKKSVTQLIEEFKP